MNRVIFISFRLALCTVATELPTAVYGSGTTEAPQEVTRVQLQRVKGYLQSLEEDLRAAAYRACRARGESFRVLYMELLENANQHHRKQLAVMVKNSTGPGTARAEALENWRAWKPLAQRVREFILIDHHKDPAKHLQMDKDFREVDRAWDRVIESSQRAEKAESEVRNRVESTLAALREIHREMIWCQLRGGDADAKEEEGIEVDRDLAGKLAELEDVRAALESLVLVHAFNEGLGWAGPTSKEFARLLNNRRAALGLQLLRLDEKLSDACTSHSKEMAAMGYFSHESPVAENQTFVQRAGKAGFVGHLRGECIFAGRAESTEAESAWWYSDGHRLVTCDPGADLLGIGPVGITWTLVTGNR